MISFSNKGNFDKTSKFLNKISKINIKNLLDKYGQLGVNALSSATPISSGETAKSWGYYLTISSKSSTITWTNSHVVDGLPIAILIQYGHGTRNGGYVEGVDFINPALKHLFDNLAEEAWKEITRQ